MLNINFVPEDYIRNNELNRTNLMYTVLLLIVMIALGSTFATVKIRQRAIAAKEKLVEAKMVKARTAIKQFEELQAKARAMRKTALTAAELLEPIPRSVILACLTNNLPPGASFVGFRLIQKAAKKPRQPVPTTKYKEQQAKKSAPNARVTGERLLNVSMEISGVAPSDLQVAAYIENLTCSKLLDNVALVESKEHKVGENVYRKFKLTSTLREGVQLTKEDVKKIRADFIRNIIGTASQALPGEADTEKGQRL